MASRHRTHEHFTFKTSPNPLIDASKKRFLLMRNRRFLRVRSRLTGEQLLTGDRVSVIVPIYNVERYIRAALDSIRFQRYPNLEVILVDDGSTDDSRAIAEHYARRDDRFSIIASTRQGPGAARNLGIERATGKYLCFVDSDDIVPIGGIYKLVESLHSSGSDFATGAYEHLHGNGRWKPPWVVTQHAEDRAGVALVDAPGIVRNIFPWNKVFRKSFFDEAIGEFPEGTLYEDQVPTATAYTRAQAFDIVQDTVYLWRKRPTGDSITQNRASLGHLRNRFEVMDQVWQIYRVQGPATAYGEWLEKTLFLDMPPFLELAPHASPEFRSELFLKCSSVASALAELHE